MRPGNDRGFPREREVAEQLQKCREREDNRGSSFPPPPAGGGATAAEFTNWRRGRRSLGPCSSEGAAWTVVSRERREQEERSGAERNPRSISSRIPPGVAGVWEVSAGASSGVRTLPERKRLPVGIISRHS